MFVEKRVTMIENTLYVHVSKQNVFSSIKQNATVYGEDDNTCSCAQCMQKKVGMIN